jgi:hypothetical protein
MENIEQKISNLVEQQFPAFYQEEGPAFISFVKAYYAWMEEEGNTINQSRNILNYRDLDETLEDFLLFFQKKYLYGIPFNTIINKRKLLKHVLDVYRTKGSIQCFELLFKLIYNQKMELYLPSRDILKPSDGTWKERKYIEISESELSPSFVGKTIRGIASGTTAIVESYVTEPFYDNIIHIFYLSNISPKGGDFAVGEKIVSQQLLDTTDNLSATLLNSPVISGSLDNVEIISGGKGFSLGDVLKIAHRDANNNIISLGKEGQVKVTSLRNGRGQLVFTLINGGWGYMLDSETFIYRFEGDTTGFGASFGIDSLAYTKQIEYCCDLICGFLGDVINTVNTNGFTALFNNDPPIPLVFDETPLGTILTFKEGQIGAIASLGNLNSGNNYTAVPYTFIKTVIQSSPLDGSLKYNSNSTIVYGANTEFDSFLEANGIIYIQADFNDGNTIESHIIRSIDNQVNIFANTFGVDAANDVLYITDANSIFNVNDYVFYAVPSTNTVIAGLTANSYYYISFANSSSLALSLTEGGTNIDITETRTSFPGETHTLTNEVSRKLTLYGKPSLNSTATAVYRIGADILTSNYPPNSSVFDLISEFSLNAIANVYATPYDTSNSIVATTKAVVSGSGYYEGEFVKLYLYGGVNTPSILNGGIDYTNNDVVLFSGGDPNVPAKGFVTTDSTGKINAVGMTFFGSGYTSVPTIYVKSNTGSNAILTTTLTDYNYENEVTGRVRKSGLGTEKGRWTTTRGFLNSDKYIQDSYYYQDFSYELQTSVKLNKYKKILYDTFHIAGTEMFGKYLLVKTESSPITVGDGFGPFLATITYANTITVDSTNTLFNSDSTLISIDQTYVANTTI